MDKTIYKKDSKGKIRFLHVYTVNGELHQDSGIVGSDKKVEHVSACKPKNVGRANETTAIEQAELEGNAKVETKMSSGYFTTIKQAESEVVILPMLAKSGTDNDNRELNKIDWSLPVFVQPKLDGMRAMCGHRMPMTSRKGKRIETMGHIEAGILAREDKYILDGELYAHGRNFQENMRLIKKHRGAETEEVRFHTYDLILPDTPFEERYAILNSISHKFPNTTLVPTVEVKDMEMLKRMHKKYLAQGYEGTIIRHGNNGYAVGKRDSQLLKYKDFLDVACTIIDVIPTEKNPKHGMFRCEIRVPDVQAQVSKRFNCNMKYSHKEREEILLNKDKYIGKTAEIRFFEYSEDGVPRFPVAVGIREDLT